MAAAALLHSVVLNHPFFNGHMRTALVAMLVYLDENGVTMRVVTHEMGFARGVADRLVFMDGGVVVDEGMPAEVLSNAARAHEDLLLESPLGGYQLGASAGMPTARAASARRTS